MILVDRDILARREAGDLDVVPWKPERLGTNSYDVELHKTLKVYEPHTQMRIFNKGLGIFQDLPVIDMAKEMRTRKFDIPEEGFVLMPGILYLGRTVEHTVTNGNLVPMLEGRSSIGRLGCFIHATAGFGDCGFSGTWTLEITVTQPLRIYAGIRIGQLYWMQGSGTPDRLYSEGRKYQEQEEPTESKLYLELAGKAAG